MSKVHARLGETSEHYTPGEYVEAARACMGGIDLDPASCAVANATVKATKFFAIEDDGLARSWGVPSWAMEAPHPLAPRVFLNSPYSGYRGQATDWGRKLLKEYQAGAIKAAVVLVNATMLYHSPFQSLMSLGAVCITDHRIRFISGVTGLPQAQPPQPNAFIYVGGDIGAFRKAFSEFGTVLRGAEYTIGF